MTMYAATWGNLGLLEKLVLQQASDNYSFDWSSDAWLLEQMILKRFTGAVDVLLHRGKIGILKEVLLPLLNLAVHRVSRMNLSHSYLKREHLKPGHRTLEYILTPMLTNNESLQSEIHNALAYATEMRLPIITQMLLDAGAPSRKGAVAPSTEEGPVAPAAIGEDFETPTTTIINKDPAAVRNARATALDVIYGLKDLKGNAGLPVLNLLFSHN